MSGQLRGEKHGRALLREVDVVAIRRRMRAGASHVDLAPKYPHVDPVTIFRAGTGRTWIHLDEPPSPERLPRRRRERTADVG